MTTRQQKAEHAVAVTLERIKRNQSSEDHSVELKSEFPAIPVDAWPAARDADKAYRFVRQIAAHANAAHGEDIYWIIGVDPRRGVIGADENELADWHRLFASYFEGRVGPSLEHYNVW